MVSDLTTQVQIPAQTGNKTGVTQTVYVVLLIKWKYLIALMSMVKSSRTSEHVEVRDLVVQWLSAVGK